MFITLEVLRKANASVGGHLVRSLSLDFAIELQRNSRLSPFTKLAYIWRAILIDHPFSDGNKRTAVFAAQRFAETYDKRVDEDLLLNYAVDIAKANMTDIKSIEWRLNNAIK